MKKNLLIMLLACLACLTGSQKAFALEQDESGTYQITNAQDLEDFSQLVADGNVSINAVLTADIDMKKINHLPIGNTSNRYKGTFDGQGHYIMAMEISRSSEDYVGLFGVLTGGAYIKNVAIYADCAISGHAFVGGIAGGTNGNGIVTFENCGNEGAVGAEQQNAAGICGVSMNGECSIVIKNCYNTGVISGDRESAALCGWVGNNGSSITNCYNAGRIIGMDGEYSLWRNPNGKGLNNYDSYGYQGQKISDDEFDLMSGMVTYQINGNQSEDVVWYQTLGEDMVPVPFASHKVVYAVGELYCDGTSKGGDPEYSNENTSIRDPHKFVDGICSECNTPDKEFLPLTADGYYEIGNAVQLNWFAEMVNHSEKNMKVRLTSDIDFTEYTLKDVMIGGDIYSANDSDEDNARSFNGIFDGQAHTITIKYDAAYDGCALFKCVSSATIRNLVVKGSIKNSEKFIGGLGLINWGKSLFENIIVDVDIESSYSGDATHGGFFAVCNDIAQFRNCAFIGSMLCDLCEGSAAIIGYSHNTSARIENCYVNSEDLYMTGNSTIFARHIDNLTNCYYNDFDGMMWLTLEGNQEATVFDNAQLASGELCYTINNNAISDKNKWYQTIGTDPYPVPFEGHGEVFANGSMNCDGTPTGTITYSNEETQMVKAGHQYVDGICSVCGSRTISTAAQLVAVAEAINSGEEERKIDIDLTNDIDMTGITDFEGIGTRFSEDTGEINPENNEPIMRDVKRPFKGTFDGHGFTVKNILIDSPDGNKGLIGLAQDATVKNVVVTGEIYAEGWAAGIVGTAIGKEPLTIENCGNECMVNVVEANAAGILGVADRSEPYVRIINCYNTGAIIGGRESATICGWLGDMGKFEVVNCYNSGTINEDAVDGIKTFARYNGSNAEFDNCYEVGGQQIEQVTADAVASGELCYTLNQGAGKTIYYQTLGEDTHPVLNAEHKVVYRDGEGNYSNNELDGIESVTAKTANFQGCYDLQGRHLTTAVKGQINIVRMADGTVRKVMVK